VLFTDIVDSTQRASELGDATWRALLERHDALVATEVTSAGGRLVKSLGDGALAAFSGPARAIGCAQSLAERAEDLGIVLRAGVHTGECEAMGDDLGGLAVHIGARVAALAEPGEILVSTTVVDLVVGSGLGFSDRGHRDLKGVPGTWQLFAVTGQDTTGRAPIDAPDDHMTGTDRATVRLARRAPGVLRALGRFAQRG
jgi:class 3 adenylate cyclase